MPRREYYRRREYRYKKYPEPKYYYDYHTQRRDINEFRRHRKIQEDDPEARSDSLWEQYVLPAIRTWGKYLPYGEYASAAAGIGTEIYRGYRKAYYDSLPGLEHYEQYSSLPDPDFE